MSDIIDRLALQAFMTVKIESDSLYEDCLAEILRLRAENEKLRAALKPFASYSAWLSEEEEETGNRVKDTDSQPVSIQYLRAAAAAIRESVE